MSLGPTGNVELREQTAALAHRHRRYGVGIIDSKLRQKGLVMNYKQVERLYQEAGLQVRRRTPSPAWLWPGPAAIRQAALSKVLKRVSGKAVAMGVGGGTALGGVTRSWG